MTIARFFLHERGLSIIPLDHPDSTHERDPKRIGKVPRIRWEVFNARNRATTISSLGLATARRAMSASSRARCRAWSRRRRNPEALEWMRAHLAAHTNGDPDRQRRALVLPISWHADSQQSQTAYQRQPAHDRCPRRRRLRGRPDLEACDGRDLRATGHLAEHRRASGVRPGLDRHRAGAARRRGARHTKHTGDRSR